MVPEDPKAIAAAIEAALAKLDARLAKDRDSVAAARDLPAETRAEGLAALDGLRRSADDVMGILRAADDARAASDRSET